MSVQLEPMSAGAGSFCAICQTGIAAGEQAGCCPACASPFHDECWAENGGCASYGCQHMPETIKEVDPVAPQSYWGAEEKACPKCGQQIKVAALRCRHCGTVFDTSDPMNEQEWRRKQTEAPQLDAARQAAVALFVLGVLPCTAPLCLLGGGLWYRSHRELVARLPGTHRVLLLVGLGSSVLSSAVLVLVAILYGGS